MKKWKKWLRRRTPTMDKLLLIGSTNVNDGADIQTEVDLALGPKGKRQLITEPAYI